MGRLALKRKDNVPPDEESEKNKRYVPLAIDAIDAAASRAVAASCRRQPLPRSPQSLLWVQVCCHSAACRPAAGATAAAPSAACAAAHTQPGCG